MKHPVINSLLLFINAIMFLLLILICNNLGVINLNTVTSWIVPTKQVLTGLLSNDYVINILCTVITALALYFFQIKYSKFKLRNDFRCNEIIHDIYSSIEETQKITKEVEVLNADIEELKNLPYEEKEKREAEMRLAFYSKHRGILKINNLTLTYHNNDILIESVNTVFFINLNFKLLNIVNNIKNRKPNLIESFPKIESYYEEYQRENNVDILRLFSWELRRYLIDIKFMAAFYYDLLNYLGYDPMPVKLLSSLFKLQYPTDEDAINFFNLPASQQNKVIKKMNRTVKWAYFKHKLKRFFAG